MSEVRHISEEFRSCVFIHQRGVVLMECVLVLPVLTLLMFAVVQFALIWHAQIMTHYAAYNAARATLVYHPGEYTTTNEYGEVVFRSKSGVCWEAACQSLAWVSSSRTDKESGLKIPGWWTTNKERLPYSSAIAGQVQIVAEGCEENYSGKPVVKVTVGFDYPLYVPVIGKMLAYFSHVEESQPSRWEITGWTTSAEGLAALDAANRRTMLGVDYMTLTSTVLMPKLWSTKRYARRPSQHGAGQ